LTPYYENNDANNNTLLNHTYMNSPLNKNKINSTIPQQNQIESLQLCRVMFAFESMDESTLTVNENEILQVLQMHDDNLNNEWWLLKKTNNQHNHNDISNNEIKRDVCGYVPSNYVEIINE
jgi:hypothetical protein